MKRTILAVLLAALVTSTEAALPDPATGGYHGGPIDLLLLKGRVEVGFGQDVPLDPAYLKQLRDRGFRITEAFDFQTLTCEYLRQFNAIIYISPSACFSGSYFNPAGWRGGMHLLTARQNLELLRAYVEEGGGMLLAPALEETGMSKINSHALLLKPYGLEPRCAQVRDMEHAFESEKVNGVIPIHFAWTEQIVPHPATEGVKRIYYPTHIMRWDDNYTTIPFAPKDPAWRVLVRGESTSVSAWNKGGLWDPKQIWWPIAGQGSPPIVLAREYGQGRVAVVGINHFHLFYFTYNEKVKNYCECYFGPTAGVVMEKGDGKTPSDLRVLLENLYRWLSAPGVPRDFGGSEARGAKLGEAPKPSVDNVSAVWADQDPLVKGAIRPIKILIGARTIASDGKGTVADYAATARGAGYDVICFTETFEQLNRQSFEKLVIECDRLSNERAHFVPGVDIADALGNRFLLVGLRHYLREHLLTPDGKRLERTGHLLLGMGDVLPIASRPQRNAALRANGRLPYDLYSHTVGFPLATYRGNEQVDDGMEAYRWHLFNASQPIPVAVHEVYSPEELGSAAAVGFQSYVNSDTPSNAAFYFVQGLESFGGNPMRHYVSSGPLVNAAGFDDWQNPHWTFTLRAHSLRPIQEVQVYDQQSLYRRFRPASEKVMIQWRGDLGRQHWFLVELIDAAGGKAWLAPIRTLPERNFIRCTDRQNWFGRIHSSLLAYTGRTRSWPPHAMLALPGVELPAQICPRLQLPYAGPGHVITEYLVNSTLVPGTPDPGADSAPIFNELPTDAVEGRVRHIFYLPLHQPEAVSPNFKQVVVDVTIRRPLAANGRVWPVIGQIGPQETLPVDGYVDVPAGGYAGNLIALTPLRVGPEGRIGFAAPGEGQTVVAGASYHGSFLIVATNQIAAVRRSMGFDGPTPYSINMKQGKLERVAALIEMKASEYGAAGTIKGAPIPAWDNGVAPVPLQLSNVNSHWPIGLWTPTTLDQYGCFEGMALGRLDVTKDTDFYFGNLLLASDERLMLAFAAPWTSKETVVEVNNPTDQPITATIRSAKFISDRIAVNQTVTIAPGTSICFTVAAKP